MSDNQPNAPAADAVTEQEIAASIAEMHGIDNAVSWALDRLNNKAGSEVRRGYREDRDACMIVLEYLSEIGKEYRRLLQHARAAVVEVEEMRTDKERLDWWSEHLNYESCRNLEPEEVSEGEVMMFRVHGPINDREWTPVAVAPTLRKAIDEARIYHAKPNVEATHVR